MGLKLENSEMREHLGAEDPACRALAETVVWIVDEQHVRVPPSRGGWTRCGWVPQPPRSSHLEAAGGSSSEGC